MENVLRGGLKTVFVYMENDFCFKTAVDSVYWCDGSKKLEPGRNDQDIKNVWARVWMKLT